MGRIIDWARNRSPWILHLNCGSCNGCDIETIDALMPRYDIERFGIQQKDTPRHADILVATGPVTEQMAPRLKRVYEQMPEPKLVIAAGSCASTGGVFVDCYNCREGIDDVIPVDMYIPGCPTSPEALIDGIIKLLKESGQEARAERLAEKKPEIVEEGTPIDEAVPEEPNGDHTETDDTPQEGTDEPEPVEA